MTDKRVRELRRYIEEGVSHLDDRTASKCVELSGTLKNDGSFIEAGTRIQWRGKLVSAKVGLWDRTENNPDNLPDMWDPVMYLDGIRIIPSVITVISLFSSGELGWWGDLLYRSKVDNNAYTPEQFPANWDLVE